MDNNGSHMAGSRTYKKDAGENANHSTALCVSRSHLLQLFICVGGFLRLLFKMYLYISCELLSILLYEGTKTIIQFQSLKLYRTTGIQSSLYIRITWTAAQKFRFLSSIPDLWNQYPRGESKKSVFFNEFHAQALGWVVFIH